MSAKLFFTESAFDKSKQEELQFEYLKEWISSAHQRTVVDTEPPGSACPFQSLAKAITHAYSLPTEHLTEERVRAILVKTYKDLNETDLQRVASAKLEEKTSFFCMTAAFRDVQAVREYWNWYLYCLTHRTAEIYDDDCNAGVVRMPLDNVDLQVLASFFCTGIVVSKLDSCALKFLPGSGRAPKAAIHLLNHKSLWAPMLGKKPTTNELHGQLVQLQALEGGPFHDFTNKAGLVVRDQSQQLFYKVNVGQHHLPIEPHQLHVIRDQIAPMFERSSSSTRGWQLGSPLGHAPSFRGIPDGSVEFQILLELVGDMLSNYLTQSREEMLGNAQQPAQPGRTRRNDRDNVPDRFYGNEPIEPERPLPVPAAHNTDFKSKRVMLSEVQAYMARYVGDTVKIWVRCPSTYGQGHSQWEQYFLPMSKGQLYCIQKTKETPDFGLLFKGFQGGPNSTEPRPELKWMFAGFLCLWEVQEPTKMWQGEQVIHLESGEVFHLVDLLEPKREQKAIARSWKKEGPLKEGMINLKDPHLRPFLCVRRDYPDGTVEGVQAC